MFYVGFGDSGFGFGVFGVGGFWILLGWLGCWLGVFSCCSIRCVMLLGVVCWCRF